MDLLKKAYKKNIKIAVIGLGYVGLPLAVEFALNGFSVLGVDTDKRKLNKIKNGVSYIEDVFDTILKKLVKTKHLLTTNDYSKLAEVDVIIICVPTPMRKSKEPDVSYVIKATKQIARYIKQKQLIVLESTTYPGTTDELILPILSKNKRKVGRDFFLGFSPERVDPGNKKYSTPNIPKVVGGITPECLNLITAVYNHIFLEVVPVSSTKVAETVKLLENTFRTVNIALVNEIAQMCHKMGIDVWEVIKGASTKPFGFMPFYPGPGIGGACLPKDPIYLAWRAKHFDFHSRFIDIASDITTLMPKYIIGRIKELLREHKKISLKSAKILILGVAYKKDLGDTRDSPALEIINLLQKTGSKVVYNDPYVPEIVIGPRGKKYRSVNISKKLLNNIDISVITTNHSEYKLTEIIEYSSLVFDTRGVTWGLSCSDTTVVRL